MGVVLCLYPLSTWFVGMCVTACALQRDILCYNYRVKVNDLGTDPDCDNCEKPPRIKQPQSMAVNVKLVALDKLKAASIRQSSKPNENRGERACCISGLFCSLRSTGPLNMDSGL